MAQLIQPGYIRSARDSFARPGDTTAYAVGDAIANSTTASLVVPMQFQVALGNGGTGKIIGARLFLDSASAFGAMRLHLFNRAPFAAAGYQADNAALALTYTALKTGAVDSGATNTAGNIPNALPYIDFPSFVAQSASAEAIGQCDQTELEFQCTPDTNVIYGLLEARAIFTPANAGNYTVALSVQGVA